MKNDFSLGIIDYFVEKISGHWWNIFFMGLLSVVIGVMAIIWPDITMRALVYLLGFFIILFGLWQIRMAFKLRGIRKHYSKLKEELKEKFWD